MSPSSTSLDASYARCRQWVRRSGSSFAVSFRRLPAEKRRAMDALYAFMRHTDDLGDSDLPVADRRRLLSAWRDSLRLALGAQNTISVEPGDEPEPARLLLPALADAVRRFGIPPDCLEAVIDGQEMDLSGRRYATFEELSDYCEKVASAVGLACIHVWGFRGDKAVEPARRFAIALQCTNILRDLREDAAAGRVYVPLADLAACGYSETEWLERVAAGEGGDRFGRLIGLEVERIRRLYVAADELCRWLEPVGRRAVGAMKGVYRRLLDKIAACPDRVLRGRVRLSGWEKCLIVMRWMW